MCELEPGSPRSIVIPGLDPGMTNNDRQKCVCGGRNPAAKSFAGFALAAPRVEGPRSTALSKSNSHLAIEQRDAFLCRRTNEVGIGFWMLCQYPARTLTIRVRHGIASGEQIVFDEVFDCVGQWGTLKNCCRARHSGALRRREPGISCWLRLQKFEIPGSSFGSPGMTSWAGCH